MLKLAQLIVVTEKRSPHSLDEITRIELPTQSTAQPPSHSSVKVVSVLAQQGLDRRLGPTRDLFHQILKRALRFTRQRGHRRIDVLANRKSFAHQTLVQSPNPRTLPKNGIHSINAPNDLDI